MKKSILIICFMILATPICSAEEPQTETLSGYPLSIEECVRLTLQNNFDITIGKLERKVLSYNVLDAKKIYDTTWTASVGFTEDNKESTLSSADQRDTKVSWATALKKKLSTGSTITLSIDDARTKETGYERNYTDTTGISINQPLLNNGFGYTDRRNVKIVRLDASRLDLATLDGIEENIAQVYYAYWDLVFAYTSLKAKETAFDFAENFLTVTREQVTNGALEDTDLYSAESNFLKKQDAVIVAKQYIEDLSDELKYAMNLVHPALLRPIDTLTTTKDPFTEEASIRTALEHHRGLRQAKLAAEAAALKLEMNKNKRLPELDLTATITGNGLDSSWKHAFGEAKAFEDPTYFTGLAFSFPLENREARAAAHQSEYIEAQKIWTIKKIESMIYTTVRRLLRSIDTTYEQATIKEKTYNYEYMKTQEEEKKYSYGRSSSDIVIRFQDDALNAKIAWAASQAYLHKEHIALKRAQNVLLDELEWTTYENISEK